MNYDKIHRNRWRIFEIICYIFISVALFISMSIFKWGHQIHWQDDNYVADGDYLGNLGDFTAGTVGSLIALLNVFLLYRTLRLQSIANKDNRTLLEVQRFNDLYFNLISLLDKTAPNYQDVQKFRAEINKSTRVNGCFDERMDDAVAKYNEIYMKHPELAAYFRTLYRILDLISTSDINDKEKIKYSKILRARFSGDELYLMRYNSLTPQGHKLGKYLWSYHILKHLSATHTAEMYPRLVGLNENELRIINSLYDSLRRVAAPNSQNKNGVNRYSGPFYMKVRRSDLNPEESTLTLNVNLDLFHFKESKETYPVLMRMSQTEAEDLLADIVGLFNSFSPHSHAVAKLYRKRNRMNVTLFAIHISGKEESNDELKLDF